MAADENTLSELDALDALIATLEQDLIVTEQIEQSFELEEQQIERLVSALNYIEVELADGTVESLARAREFIETLDE